MTVHGGVPIALLRIRCTVAAQLLWQSSSAPQMPPLRTSSNAAWCGSGDQVQTSSSPSSKLRMRSPLSLAGPQPKQRFLGA